MTKLLLLQLVFLALGAGALPALGIVHGPAQLRARLPLAYLVGVALAGIVAADLALLNAGVGVTELVVLTILVWLVAWRRLRGSSGRVTQRSKAGVWVGIVGGIALALAFLLLAHVMHMLETRPLYEWDGWAIWATKARALYDFGGAYGPVFRRVSAGAASAAAAGARGDRLPRAGTLRRDAPARAARPARLRVRGGALDAAARARPRRARGTRRARDRLRDGVREAAVDQLRGCPARALRRARRRLPRALARRGGCDAASRRRDLPRRGDADEAGGAALRDRGVVAALVAAAARLRGTLLTVSPSR